MGQSLQDEETARDPPRRNRVEDNQNNNNNTLPTYHPKNTSITPTSHPQPMSGQKGKPPRNTAVPKIRGLSQEDEETVRGPPQQELSANGEGSMKLKGCNEEELV